MKKTVIKDHSLVQLFMFTHKFELLYMYSVSMPTYECLMLHLHALTFHVHSKLFVRVQ